MSLVALYNEAIEIDAVNTGGFAPFDMHIIVQQIAISYQNASLHFVHDTDVGRWDAVVTPVNGADLFTIVPNLPAGLKLIAANGSIHGTAAELSPGAT